jgi:hypothetical protein
MSVRKDKRRSSPPARGAMIKPYDLYPNHKETYPRRQGWLAIEFFLLYIGFPAAFNTILHTYSPVPFLLAFGLAAAVYLIYNPDFSNRSFFNVKAVKAQLPRILLIFVPAGFILLAFVRVKYPHYLFYCPKNHITVWLSILWSYPLLAVYPQEIIYRSFLFHRYRSLFGNSRYLMHASAWVFSFDHIIYYHPFSLLATLVGGYLFAYTYWKSRSLLAASMEHALYGCFLYTIGLGRFFYTGIEKLLG